MGRPEAASGFAGSHGGCQGHAPQEGMTLAPSMKPMLRWTHAHLFQITEITEIGGKKTFRRAATAPQRRLAAGQPPELQWEQALPAFRSW